MKNRSGWLIAAVSIAAVACLCLAISGLLGGAAFLGLRKLPTVIAQVTIVPGITLEPPIKPATAVPPAAFPTPAPPGQTNGTTGPVDETLKTLENALVPNNDPRDLAERLKGIKDIPLTLPAPAKPFQVGDTMKFWANNDETHQNFQVDTQLAFITPHAYFWMGKDTQYNQADLKKLADTFENQIYPTDRKFFGSEWTPGIDSDPHIYVIYARGLGGRIAGYFNSTDEINPKAMQYSNGHEDFFFNADNVSLGLDAYSTLAHEFQHMIHWYRDRNEESWMNEGFSVLAELLNGYDTGGFDQLFAQDPDTQLTDWPNDPNAVAPHYGESFLFLTYFLDRFGEKSTQAVVANQDNGMDSIDKVLQDEGVKDKQTGKPIQANDVFADWAVTNYLLDGRVGDGRYTYNNYPNAPRVSDTETINRCPVDWQNRTVHQYGADYIRISCQGNVTLNFEGVAQVGVLPANPYSGNYAFWSNKGDESDMTLTRDFDFSSAKSPLTMSYWTWYDLEKDFDYLYLEASTDGKSWEILKTPSCNDTNPVGNNYGCGYTGVTDGWKQETVDLSKFAGKKVQLRFEYITDPAVNGEGLLLDDISLPALNYQTDFEKDDGGWKAAGFVRIENKLPQTYQLSIIKNGQTITVETLTLDANQKGSLPLDFGADLKDAVLVVSGTTRFTRQEATYRYQLEQSGGTVMR